MAHGRVQMAQGCTFQLKQPEWEWVVGEEVGLVCLCQGQLRQHLNCWSGGKVEKEGG